MSTHPVTRHLFTIGSALSLLLALGVFALWLVWVALFARRYPAPGVGRGSAPAF